MSDQETFDVLVQFRYLCGPDDSSVCGRFPSDLRSGLRLVTGGIFARRISTLFSYLPL